MYMYPSTQKKSKHKLHDPNPNPSHTNCFLTNIREVPSKPSIPSLVSTRFILHSKTPKRNRKRYIKKKERKGKRRRRRRRRTETPQKLPKSHHSKPSSCSMPPQVVVRIQDSFRSFSLCFLNFPPSRLDGKVVAVPRADVFPAPRVGHELAF